MCISPHPCEWQVEVAICSWLSWWKDGETLGNSGVACKLWVQTSSMGTQSHSVWEGEGLKWKHEKSEFHGALKLHFVKPGERFKSAKCKLVALTCSQSHPQYGLKTAWNWRRFESVTWKSEQQRWKEHMKIPREQARRSECSWAAKDQK